MKQIKIDEEFTFNGIVWKFTDEEGKTVLKKLRPNTRAKEFASPTVEEVIAYFSQKGYSEEAAVKFHEYYKEGGWKDGKGHEIKNWKQKAMSVWFTDKNKAQDKKQAVKEGDFLF